MVALYVIVGLALLPGAIATALLIVGWVLGLVETLLSLPMALRKRARHRSFLRSLLEGHSEGRKSPPGAGDVSEPATGEESQKRGI